MGYLLLGDPLSKGLGVYTLPYRCDTVLRSVLLALKVFGTHCYTACPYKLCDLGCFLFFSHVRLDRKRRSHPCLGVASGSLSRAEGSGSLVVLVKARAFECN